MAEQPSPYFNLKDVHGIAVVQVISREIRHPASAIEFGEHVAKLLTDGGYKRMLIDFDGTEYLGSTAFATLLNLAKKIDAAGGTLKICGMNPDVLVGANIIGLGRVIEILQDERSALDTF